MDYAVVITPAAPIRRKPDHRKEMVNQLLFGEAVEVLKQKGELWVRIRSLHDSYEGWMSGSMLTAIEEKDVNAGRGFVTTDILSPISSGDMTFQIPVGSSLPFFENGKGRIGANEYHFSGHYFKLDEQQFSGELVKRLALPWVNAPYLWGGRTPLGVDCSGFVQVIFKQLGVDMPRDAWQQAQEGIMVKKFSEVQTGDLAFFDNKEDIVHTGIMLGEDRIIHASGKVRIDPIDKKGIINGETGKRMLRLKAIRRVF